MRGSALLVLILLFALLWHNSRWSRPGQVEAPALLRSGPGVVTFALNREGCPTGVHQLNDADGMGGVIKLTNAKLTSEIGLSVAATAAPSSGELYEIRLLDGEVIGFERKWMSASHRILLGVPLHPDHMTIVDWEFLPGIGPKLAADIECDRQKNGDFLTLEALDRVKGVGPKKLEQWKPFFYPRSDLME